MACYSLGLVYGVEGLRVEGLGLHGTGLPSGCIPSFHLVRNIAVWAMQGRPVLGQFRVPKTLREVLGSVSTSRVIKAFSRSSKCALDYLIVLHLGECLFRCV